MLYVIKFENGMYLQISKKLMTQSIKDAAYFSKLSGAKTFMDTCLRKELRDRAPEVRQVFGLSKISNNRPVFEKGVVYTDEPVGKIHTVTPNYGEVKEISNVVVSKTVDTEVKSEFDTYKSKLTDKKGKLIALLSEYDKKQEDILHCAELMSLDAVKRVKLMNALVEVRRKRREIKEQCSQIDSILCAIGKVDFKKEKSYEYSSDLVVNVLSGGTV